MHLQYVSFLFLKTNFWLQSLFIWVYAYNFLLGFIKAITLAKKVLPTKKAHILNQLNELYPTIYNTCRNRKYFIWKFLLCSNTSKFVYILIFTNLGTMLIFSFFMIKFLNIKILKQKLYIRIKNKKLHRIVFFFFS